MTAIRRAIVALLVASTTAAAQSATQAARPRANHAVVRVGPERGTVIVVGGGAMGPEITDRFIQAAGGPNALIVDIPTAGGAATYDQNAPGAKGLRRAGARNVVVLHTTDRKVADTDSFPSIIARAGGVWFEGGRQFHLVDSYAGTKTEQAFHDVLARGGVVGGSSAGASILGDFLVRGAPSNNNYIMDYPGYEKGFAFLRNVGIDQHVVARSRMADLADSIMPKHRGLLGISEDEGTAWVVRGDTALIVGRNRAFAYGGKATDPGKPFLTLHPGDRYDLGARRVISRAIASTALTSKFIDSLFRKYNNSGHAATVLVAQDGNVYVSNAYGVPPRPKFVPGTTEPQFDLGGISAVYDTLASELAARGSGTRPNMRQLYARSIFTPVGMHRTTVDTATGMIHSDVDEMYRFALGLTFPPTFFRDSAAADGSDASAAAEVNRGWTADTYKGAARLSAYYTPDGKRAAFVRYPDQGATIIVLTNDDAANAKGLADKIADRLLFSK
ncbi:MAG TPA: Type 1 glutamine amidotransferase-like domain-containing protein [Gemmatimonadaceae bacterium]|nr:Type 1 glutamine amidotransferase-like domain-containing protein [Gemmatimonadaceae bacterium]